jgi:5-(hydroxymethyl)furfural/furfural oxidase
VLANRLSAKSANRVLLLEAGQDTPPGGEPADVLDTYPVSYYNRAYTWQGLRGHWRGRIARRKWRFVRRASLATPVLHPAQAAVLGIGRAAPRMVVDEADSRGWSVRGYSPSRSPTTTAS